MCDSSIICLYTVQGRNLKEGVDGRTISKVPGWSCLQEYISMYTCRNCLLIVNRQYTVQLWYLRQ